MTENVKYPCSCASDCPICTGVAAFATLRDGQIRLLCTRCTSPGDEYIGRLYTISDIPELAKLDRLSTLRNNKLAEPFQELFDLMGGIDALLTLSLKLPLYTPSDN